MAALQHFYSFPRLPTEVRDRIWHYAFAQPEPRVKLFGVAKVKAEARTRLPGSDISYMYSVGSYKSVLNLRDHSFSGGEKLGLLLPSYSKISGDGQHRGGGGLASFENFGLLNACRESRNATLWYAECYLGNSYLPVFMPLKKAAPGCLTIDVAQDLVCLRPCWEDSDPWKYGCFRYELDVLKDLRVEKSGHALTKLAIEYDPCLVIGSRVEDGYHRKLFHHFVIEMLAHLKRETFNEADYPPIKWRVDEDDDDDEDNDSDFDNASVEGEEPQGSEGSGAEDGTEEPETEFVEEQEPEIFEANYGFNHHYEFKGKFYLIDYRIQLRDPSMLESLERSRQPEFVNGTKKFYKVAMQDKFFNVGPVGTNTFMLLNELERHALREEYGVIPPDAPFWTLNPMNFFHGSIGCSMYALACVDTADS